MAAGGRSSKATVALATFAAALVLLAMPRCGRADITCDQVKSTLSPCRWYLAGWPSAPSSACCNGVRAMAAAGQTTQDRQAICSCVKSAAAGYPDGVLRRASGLPARCSVTLSYQLSPTIDCSTIN